MGNLSRQELKTFFKAGSTVKEQDFRELIDSLLNRKDDCFYGKWVPGTEYCNGAVVIYEKCLYLLAIPGVDDSCLQPSGEENTSIRSNCICSTVPPSLDVKNWCKIYQAAYDQCCYLIAPEDDGSGDRTIIYLEDVLENVLEDVCTLRPVRFDVEPKDTLDSPECDQYGLEAGAVAMHFEDILREFNGIKAINQSALITILLMAIKELKQRVEVLEQNGG